MLIRGCAAGLPRLEQLLYIGKMFVDRLQVNKVHCYLAIRPKVQGFRDQDFVLQIFLKQKALDFRASWLKKALSQGRSQTSVYQYSEQQDMPSPVLYLHVTVHTHNIRLKHIIFHCSARETTRQTYRHIHIIIAQMSRCPLEPENYTYFQ